MAKVQSIFLWQLFQWLKLLQLFWFLHKPRWKEVQINIWAGLVGREKIIYRYINHKNDFIFTKIIFDPFVFLDYMSHLWLCHVTRGLWQISIFLWQWFPMIKVSDCSDLYINHHETIYKQIIYVSDILFAIHESLYQWEFFTNFVFLVSVYPG